MVTAALARTSQSRADGEAAAGAAADPCEEAGCENPALPPPAGPPLQDDQSCRLRAAVSWASGSQKLPQECVHRIASLLSPEQASALVERHGSDKGDAAAPPKPVRLSTAMLVVKVARAP